MKHKLGFAALIAVAVATTFCGPKEKENEEKIRYSLTQEYCTPWNETKKIIKNAIEGGVTTLDIPERHETGQTPLCLALEKEDLEFAEYLLQKGANPNFEIKGYRYSRCIFFAENIDALKLLKKYHADLTAVNKCEGFKPEMNLLHASINYTTKDDKLFDYLLEQGFDPKFCIKHNANLWHSFIYPCIRYCQPEMFKKRAEKLKSLGISPYQKGDPGNLWCSKSAIELIAKQIQEEDQFLKSDDASEIRKEELRAEKEGWASSDSRSMIKSREMMLENLRYFLKIMKDCEIKTN